jgi:hypothetical protein
VLADRSLVICCSVEQEYPATRRLIYSGSGYGAGYEQGQRADVGNRLVARVAPRAVEGGGR